MCDYSIDLPNNYENWELGFTYKMGYVQVWLFRLNTSDLSTFLLFPFVFLLRFKVSIK